QDVVLASSQPIGEFRVVPGLLSTRDRAVHIAPGPFPTLEMKSRRFGEHSITGLEAKTSPNPASRLTKVADLSFPDGRRTHPNRGRSRLTHRDRTGDCQRRRFAAG